MSTVLPREEAVETIFSKILASPEASGRLSGVFYDHIDDDHRLTDNDRDHFLQVLFHAYQNGDISALLLELCGRSMFDLLREAYLIPKKFHGKAGENPVLLTDAAGELLPGEKVSAREYAKFKETYEHHECAPRSALYLADGYDLVRTYTEGLNITEEKDNDSDDDEHIDSEDEGCCHHSISKRRKRELIYHPIKHTFNIFIFILLITIILNFLIFVYSEHAVLHVLLGKVKILEPVITAFIGLIPNCAVSIALTMLLIKGSISFGAVMSGLLSNAGLGILILFRHSENIKDTFKIIAILLGISIISGMIIQIF